MCDKSRAWIRKFLFCRNTNEQRKYSSADRALILKFAAPTETLITLQYAGFAVWVTLFLVVYLVENGYKILALYALLCAVLYSLINFI